MHKQVSLTAGTVMQGSKKPLKLWLLAKFLFVVGKQGISATDLGRQLGICYPTAWTWLHKIRAPDGREEEGADRGREHRAWFGAAYG